jgi:hypothetical protein
MADMFISYAREDQAVASRWVRAEATLADRAKTLIPVMIEPCELPIVFELTHTAKLMHWSGDHRDPAIGGLLRWMEVDTSLDRIRNHPRFVALIARGQARLA